jgi:hypothetical protein
MSAPSVAPDNEQVVESAWRDQAIWSETANVLRADLVRWRYIAAVAGVLGAFLATLAASVPDPGRGWEWLRPLTAMLAAIVLAVVPYVVRTKVSPDRVSAWVRARSASEALKEQIYRYLVGAPSFAPDSPPAKLFSCTQAVKEKVKDLNVYAAGIAPSPKKRPLALSVDEYVDQRVNDQIDGYYRPKARENARTGQRLHGLEFGLGALAVILSAMASAATATGWQWLSSLGAWVAVVTTAGAAVTAYLTASRFDHAAMTYFATANRLSDLRDVWRTDPERYQPDRVARFVDDCENAISSENEAWLADWSRQDGEAKVD